MRRGAGAAEKGAMPYNSHHAGRRHDDGVTGSRTPLADAVCGRRRPAFYAARLAAARADIRTPPAPCAARLRAAKFYS